MKILLLSSIYPHKDDRNKNATKVVPYFAQEWAKMGHEVLVVHNVNRYPAFVHKIPLSIKTKLATKLSFDIPDMSDVSQQEFADGAVDVLRLPIFKIIPHGDHSASLIKKNTDKIVSWLEEKHFVPEVIIGHWMSPQAPIIAHLKQVYQCRTALVLHGRGYVNDPRFDAKKYLPYIDALGCRSRAEAEYVQQALGYPKMPFICYSGVPDAFVSKYAFDEEKFASVPENWRFIYVGRLVAYKNIDKVLYALATIKDKDFAFDIIGTGAEEAKLKDIAKKHGIADKVVFHGRMPREEVLEYMRKAHCFVMISKGEVFGLVYLEAMAASCITIGSKDEGIDGVIRDGENGMLCTAADAGDLSAVLQKMLSMDTVELRRYAKAGFETASEFTDSNVAKWYLNDVLNT